MASSSDSVAAISPLVPSLISSTLSGRDSTGRVNVLSHVDPIDAPLCHLFPETLTRPWQARPRSLRRERVQIFSHSAQAASLQHRSDVDRREAARRKPRRVPRRPTPRRAPRLPARMRLSGGDPPHLLWDAEIADPDLAEHCFHVGAEPIGEVLRQTENGFSFRLETVVDNKKMERQHEKATFERVGNAQTADRKREAAPAPQSRHRVSRRRVSAAPS